MRKLLLLAVLTAFGLGSFAEDTNYSPTLDVNFRTASGNTAWNTGYPISAADDGNTQFECNYFNGLFALQKYTVADLQNATKLVLTLYQAPSSGTDAIRVWSFPNNDWTADSGVDDMVGYATQAVGIAPRTSEGSLNTPLVEKGTWGANTLNPRPATFTISGTALATVKANASSDGTFTLMLTDGNLTSASNRKYLTSNSANGDGVPTITATIETPTVMMNGVGYSTLEEAFDAAVAAEQDATIEVSADQKLTKRQTLNKAISLTIVPTQDITIKGPKNTMWFLVNVSNATLSIGSKDHKITLDGIGDDHSTNNCHVTRRENGSKLYLTNIEFNNFTLGANNLIGCKNAGGGIYIEDIAINNCSTTGNGLIENLREANDALYLKGFLNVGTDCQGTTIYTAKNRIRMGDPDGTSMYGDFTATNVITIGTADDNYAEGTLLIVKVGSEYANKFQPAKEGWYFERNANNGDMKLTQTEPTGIDAVKGETTVNDGVYYNLAGQRVENPAKGVYIVNGKKVIKK
jgi:hypothetical protein